MQVSSVGSGGPALFFVHGFACDSSDWRAQVQRFADHTTTVTSYDELKAAIETGFAVCWWDGDSADEKRIKEETRATIRCIPNDQPGGSGTCIYTGRPATKTVVFARSY